MIGLIAIPAAVHVFLLVARPDLVSWNEFFSTKSIVGWFYSGIYAATFLLALISTVASYRKYKATK